MSEQGSLFVEPIVERDRAYDETFGGQWWIARCPECRAPLSRYDYSAEDARRFGIEALTSGEHVCRPPPKRRENSAGRRPR